MEKNRKQLLKDYPSFKMFKEKFEVPQSFIDSILKEGEKENVKPKDEAEVKATLPLLRLQMKALIARDLWDMSEYWSIMNEDSEAVKKALEVISE